MLELAYKHPRTGKRTVICQALRLARRTAYYVARAGQMAAITERSRGPEVQILSPRPYSGCSSSCCCPGFVREQPSQPGPAGAGGQIL